MRSFGIFYVKLRKPRVARNPKTGGRVDVPEKKFVRFKMSKLVRKEINKE
jgi:integration host factor subunit beta